MQRRSIWAVLAPVSLAAVGLASCTSEPEAPATPYKPVATNLELMESIVAHAAEEYWGAVRIVVDENGVTEHFPETEEEWEEVWAAGLSLAESGNLLMMPPRAVNEPEWMRISADLVDVGLEAAQAAEAQDPEAVLAVGERVYNVCLDCHNLYIPAEPE